MESRENGEVTSSQKFGEFVELGGAWWPTQIETLDAQGRRTALVTQRFQLLGTDAFAARMKELQAGREDTSSSCASRWRTCVWPRSPSTTVRVRSKTIW